MQSLTHRRDSRNYEKTRMFWSFPGRGASLLEHFLEDRQLLIFTAPKHEPLNAPRPVLVKKSVVTEFPQLAQPSTLI